MNEQLSGVYIVKHARTALIIPVMKMCSVKQPSFHF